MRNIILTGHVLEQLKLIPDKSVQCIVTSPPYWGLRSYKTIPQIWGGEKGCRHEWKSASPRRSRKETDVIDMDSKQATSVGTLHTLENSEFCQRCNSWRGELGNEPTIQLFVEHMVEIFSECWRVLRDDGTLWLNLGDSYNGSGGAGGDYGKGGLKEGQPKYPGRNVTELKPKDLCGIPWRVAFALQDAGWYLRSDIVWQKPNPMPESCSDRPTKSHEYIFLLTKKAKYYYDAEAISEPVSESYANDKRPVGVLRQKVNKNSKYPGSGQFKKMKNLEFDGQQPNTIHQLRAIGVPEQQYLSRNRRSVWTFATQSFPGAHFATFPDKLPEICIKAGTSERGCCPKCGSPWERVTEKEKSFESGSGKSGRKISGKNGVKLQGGGNTGDIRKGPVLHVSTIDWRPTCKCNHKETDPCIVLDPFAGSGTTLEVAKRLGRDYIGIELNPQYVEDFIKPMLENTMPLFDNE